MGDEARLRLLNPVLTLHSRLILGNFTLKAWTLQHNKQKPALHLVQALGYAVVLRANHVQQLVSARAISDPNDGILNIGLESRTIF